MRVKRFLRLAGLCSFVGSALLLAASWKPTFGVWHRVSDTPILSPEGDSWESAGTFNPAVVMHDGKYVMLYRAQDKQGISRLGYAESSDGVHFKRRAQPVLEPETDYEKNGGVEDPRLVKIGDTYYLTYTGYNQKDAQLCLATSQDLVHWERKGVILPANKGNWNVKWTKSGAIVPEKIAGKYWMYFLGTAADNTDQMGLASSPDLLFWTEETKTPVLPRRPGMFDSRVVEPGPAPILTSDGIVLIYNGADDKLLYRTGVVVFDLHDPRKVSLPQRAAHLRSRARLGESWASAQRCLRRGHGAPGQSIPLLLRRGRQVRRRRGGHSDNHQRPLTSLRLGSLPCRSCARLMPLARHHHSQGGFDVQNFSTTADTALSSRFRISDRSCAKIR